MEGGQHDSPVLQPAPAAQREQAVAEHLAQRAVHEGGLLVEALVLNDLRSDRVRCQCLVLLVLARPYLDTDTHPLDVVGVRGEDEQAVEHGEAAKAGPAAPQAEHDVEGVALVDAGEGEHVAEQGLRHRPGQRQLQTPKVAVADCCTPRQQRQPRQQGRQHRLRQQSARQTHGRHCAAAGVAQFREVPAKLRALRYSPELRGGLWG